MYPINNVVTPQPTPPNSMIVFLQPNLSPTIPKIRLNAIFEMKIVDQTPNHLDVGIPNDAR
ncbi:Uncharacterised protein [Staphylococcus aureus]|nr:Uncharacterised protein [Staphylococcus aureus]